MLKQVFLTLALTAVTVLIHGFGSIYVVLPIAGMWRRNAEGETQSAAVLLLVRLVCGLLLLHLIEMIVWATAFATIGALPDFETSLYFSFKSYTTVGYGDVVLPPSWRLVGPLEAAVGILMLGWSTGFIVAGVQRIFDSHWLRESRHKASQ
jgi:hypothetical protein